MGVDPWENLGKEWSDPKFRDSFMVTIVAAVRERLISEIEGELHQEALGLRKVAGRDSKQTNLYVLGLRRAVDVLRGTDRQRGRLPVVTGDGEQLAADGVPGADNPGGETQEGELLPPE